VKSKLGFIIRTLIQIVAMILSYVITAGIMKYWKYFSSHLQWYANKRQFQSVGEGSFIDSPATIVNPINIRLGKKFRAEPRLRIETFNTFEGEQFSPEMIIGDNVSFGTDCHIGCINRIEIGNNLLAASKIFITDHFHGEITSEALQTIPVRRKLSTKGPVIIEDNVWLGEGVVIMPGLRIGANAIIGANSVVTGDIPRNAVAAGVPAKVLKTL
jgi:acetyltransferase-like isoleucine patch superfamily enzyme